MLLGSKHGNIKPFVCMNNVRFLQEAVLRSEVKFLR